MCKDVLNSAGLICSMLQRPIARIKLPANVGRLSWRLMVDGWLTFVSKSKVKEFDLYICNISFEQYPLPLDILHMRSLTHLRLCGVELKNLDSIGLPSLMSLSLKGVHLDDQVLHNMLSGCCSLEKLNFRRMSKVV